MFRASLAFHRVIRARQFNPLATRKMVTTITRAVTPSGIPVSHKGLDDASSHIVELSGVPATSTTTLLLNRPKALHALTENMCAALYNRLQALRNCPHTHTVVLSSTAPAGRAFCAGGDVRALYFLREGGHPQSEVDALFRHEYRLNALLGRLHAPVHPPHRTPEESPDAPSPSVSVIAILDGVVMGGGAGLAMHGRWRVATENTIFAMPECSLGLQPDVGASYALPRLTGHLPGLAEYLVLTGGRITGRHTVAAGLATHFVPSAKLSQLMARLQTACGPTEDALSEFAEKVERDATVLPGASVIASCFASDSLHDVVSRLRGRGRTGDTGDAGDDDASGSFACEALRQIEGGCPTSLHVAWEALRRGRRADSLDEWMPVDFRLAARMTRRDDFYSGVRSMLVTKDRSPRWAPRALEQVDDGDVEWLFAPLEDDLHIAELDIGGDTGAEGRDETKQTQRPKM